MSIERLVHLPVVLSVVAAAACGGSNAATATATTTAAGSATATATATETAPAASSAAPAPSPGPIPTGGAVLVGDINAPKSFNPKPTVESMKPQLVDCYNKARAVHPDLRGKITLQIQVNEGGAVLSVDAAPGGHANDPTLVACINDAMKAGAHFPKPGGTAVVSAPLVFHP
jgi:hypothetical protein